MTSDGIHFSSLIAAGVTLLCVLIGARAFILFRRMQGLMEGLYPRPLPVTAADEIEAKALLGDFEAVSFRTADGLMIRGWYKPSTSGAAVIFIHGKSNNRHVLLSEAGAVSARGMGALLYDSRASGESDGKLHSWGHHEQLDLLAALDYLSARADIDTSRIGVHGFSVGGNTALLVGVKEARIQALVLSGACPSLAQYLWHISSRPKRMMAKLLTRKYQKAGVPVASIDLIKHIAAFSPRPLLMVRGTGSVTVPVGQVQSLFNAARDPKDMLVIEGADHTDYAAIGGQAYLKKIANFFESSLKAN